MTKAVDGLTSTPAEQTKREEARALQGSRGIIGLGVYLLILGAFLGSLVVGLWPAVEDIRSSTESSESQAALSLGLFGASISVSPESALLFLAIVFGALGSFIHTVTSFADYVGNGRFEGSWIWWYLLRPFIGASLALVLYVAIRGGFFTQEAAADVNPFGIAALAGLAGLFSKNATDKLKEVFETLFRTQPGEGDDARRHSLTNPTPTITSAARQREERAGGALLIRVSGTGFVKESTVLVDASELKPISVGPTELQVEVPARILAQGRSLVIRVKNPEPGGGISEGRTLQLGRS